MFIKIGLDYKQNLFPELLTQTTFEDVTGGRKGAVLVDMRKGLIPIVRTTTKYTNPAQKFKSLHYDIMNKIRESINIEDIGFNNALIEVYDNQYCTMGFHTDQALDLADNSYIAIYSCYENPSLNPRKLIIKNKQTNQQLELIMEHNSVILFSTTTNQQHLHKIILENVNGNNRWLGITFRLSKTFLQHIDNVPFLGKNVLTLATGEETKNFYKLRSEENKSIEYKYPEINYTISPSDLMPIN
jgi:hypothetical protein